MKLKSIFFLVVLFVSLTFISCNNSTGQNVGGQINTSISVNEFESKLNNGVQLIDVRTPDEFEGGHIKNAVNININADDFETQLSGLDKNKPVLVYCLSGGRSSSAAGIMAGMGFKEVYNMNGGIMKWNAAGKALETNAATVTNNGMSLDEFNKLVTTDNYVLVDYNALWCKPCVKMKPMLEAFVEKRKNQIQMLSVDADANKSLLMLKGIESVPVLELYKNGKLVWKHEGAIEETELIKETGL